MSDDLKPVPYSPQTDMSGLRLEQTCNGHVVTCWFSYPYQDELRNGEMTSFIGGRVHAIIGSARQAFAQALGIRESRIMVTRKQDHATLEYWWRLGTADKCELPKPKRTALPSTKIASAGAIDV